MREDAAHPAQVVQGRLAAVVRASRLCTAFQEEAHDRRLRMAAGAVQELQKVAREGAWAGIRNMQRCTKPQARHP